jgi:uncharacterized protein (DUF2147 family)
MRSALAALGLAIGFAGAAGAQSTADISGRWKDSDGESVIAIAPCGPALCGRIVWLKQPRSDRNNADPKLRERSLMGVQVLGGFKPDGTGKFAGEGYNPEDGKTYRTTLALDASGRLLVRGCVLGGLICDDDIWTREP